VTGSSEELEAARLSFGILSFHVQQAYQYCKDYGGEDHGGIYPHFSPTTVAGNGAAFPYPPLISLSNLASILLKIFL